MTADFEDAVPGDLTDEEQSRIYRLTKDKALAQIASTRVAGMLAELTGTVRTRGVVLTYDDMAAGVDSLPEPLVPGLVNDGYVSAFHAEEKAGKLDFVASMIEAIATGDDFLDLGARECAVFVLNNEDPAGHFWTAFTTKKRVDSNRLRVASELGFNLLDPDDQEWLTDELIRYRLDIGSDVPLLLVVNTQTTIHADAGFESENTSGNPHMALISAWRRVMKTAEVNGTILVAHSNGFGDLAGNKGFKRAVDLVVRMAGSRTDNGRKRRCLSSFGRTTEPIDGVFLDFDVAARRYTRAAEQVEGIGNVVSAVRKPGDSRDDYRPDWFKRSFGADPHRVLTWKGALALVDSDREEWDAANRAKRNSLRTKWQKRVKDARAKGWIVAHDVDLEGEQTYRVQADSPATRDLDFGGA